jgi:hypothetical protein
MVESLPFAVGFSRRQYSSLNKISATVGFSQRIEEHHHNPGFSPTLRDQSPVINKDLSKRRLKPMAIVLKSAAIVLKPTTFVLNLTATDFIIIWTSYAKVRKKGAQRSTIVSL